MNEVKIWKKFLESEDLESEILDSGVHNTDEFVKEALEVVSGILTELNESPLDSVPSMRVDTSREADSARGEEELAAREKRAIAKYEDYCSKNNIGLKRFLMDTARLSSNINTNY